MPLKIRCPHCHQTLLAEDETAGQGKLCPSCGKTFTVPIPVHELPRRIEVAGQCPKCGADMAPGIEYCPRCHLDMATGRRLPFRRRLQFVSVRTWMVAGLAVVAAVALVSAGLRVYQDRVRRVDQPARALAPVHRPDNVGALWVKRLLEAESAAERAQAFDELLRLGRDALPVLARALEETPVGGDANRARNRAAAVELFARGGETRWLPLLKELQRNKELRPTTLVARAMLGDEEVAEELTTLWLARLRRQMFLMRVTELVPSTVAPANQAVVRRTQSETERDAEALRRLAESPDATVIDETLTTYWEGWDWLGQQRGEVFAAELFELAKPPKRKDQEFKDRVRAARRALDRAARRGSPAARAAAAVILAERAPQYKSLRERIIAMLASILPKSEPLAQQRISWALARLTSRSFGGLSDEDSPADFGRPAVQEALKWARASAIAEPGPLRTLSTAYPRPPKPVRRVVTPRRQLERDLLGEFGSGWDGVGAALDRWLEAGLACTPRVEQLLNPGQRNPNYPALAAAMILAAASGAQHLRPQLELWREATDQPAWVRGFAYTVLGALDARRGRWASGWPAGLHAEMVAWAGREAPGLDLWGRLLAAGGPLLKARLEGAPPDSLSSAVRAKLRRAAEQGERRRPQEP
ncbi:MAG: hypothetical protein ACE5I3_13210 [Phycisphaerae bacterium]